MPQEYITVFDPEKCIACHGCEVACKSWRELPLGIKYRRVEKIWSGSYPATTLKHVVISCLHCLEPACMQACPVNAISKEAESGRVLVDSAICIGCKLCFKACPYKVPQFTKNKVMQKCDLCMHNTLGTQEPPCVATCPTRALSFVKINTALKQTEQDKILELLNKAQPS